MTDRKQEPGVSDPDEDARPEGIDEPGSDERLSREAQARIDEQRRRELDD